MKVLYKYKYEYQLITVLFCFFFFLTSVPVKSQIFDDFSDGDFTANPSWIGEVTLWQITGNQLNSNNSITNDTFYMSTPDTLIENTQWEFFCNLRLQTSSQNYSDIFLVSDKSNLQTGNSGYLVRIGGTPDEVCLYRKDSTVGIAKLIDGVDGLIAGSDNPVKIKVTRDSSGNWKLETDYGITGAFSVQGTAFDTTYLTSSWFGILVKQSTSSFFNKHFFDDIYVGPIMGDTVAPFITGVTVLSATQLDLKFSEAVEFSSSETESNYSVDNGIGNPLSAIRDGSDSTLIHLAFTASFTSGTTYQLTTVNISDAAGNILTGDTAGFLYFLYTPPSFKDVVINEIMADPDPPVTLPNSEFVEIFNAGSDIFDLYGWTITDGSSSGVLPQYYLLPGQYLILCPQANAGNFLPYGNVIGLSTWPALNNTGDLLTLLDSTAAVIDTVHYYDTWYNDEVKQNGGWSFELLNPFTPCSYTNNWEPSAHANGGTPGQQNSVYNTTDNTPPSVAGIMVSGAGQIQVTFTEPLDSAGVNISMFSVNNGIVISSIQFTNASFVSIQISFSSPLDTGIFYTLSVSWLKDCSGNQIQAGTTSQFVIGLKPQPGDVVINEIFADPTPPVSLPEAEFLELYNTTNRLVDLADCEVNGDPIPSGTYIAAVGYLIVCGTNFTSPFSVYGVSVGISAFNSSVLTNTGEMVSLTDASGLLLDKITYSDAWYRDNAKKNGGWSLERINPVSDCNFSGNWAASTDARGGTPGSKNSQFSTAPDDVKPFVSNVYVLSSTRIEVVFSKPMDSLSLMNGSYSISGGINVTAVIMGDSVEFTSVVLILGSSLELKIQYTVTVDGMTDCPGNITGTPDHRSFYLPERGEAGDLIINEVLFNPRTYGFDFVEIYNNSDKHIDLATCLMANVEDDSVTNYESIAIKQRIIVPGEYIVCTEDSGNIKKEYPQSKSGSFVQMDLPSYNDDSGTVVILFGKDTISDRFDYYSKYHFALLNDPGGISLERLDFDRNTNDATNWHSAAESSGWATPGFQNSQFNPAAEPDNPLTIDPGIFSPDNDGYNDVLNIGFKFDKPGYLGNITIFDSKGRTIKTLMRNELLGTEGIVSWDGSTDEREKARIGIYVVYFEVFNLAGEVKEYKKACVVGGK